MEIYTEADPLTDVQMLHFPRNDEYGHDDHAHDTLWLQCCARQRMEQLTHRVKCMKLVYIVNYTLCRLRRFESSDWTSKPIDAMRMAHMPFHDVAAMLRKCLVANDLRFIAEHSSSFILVLHGGTLLLYGGDRIVDVTGWLKRFQDA